MKRCLLSWLFVGWLFVSWLFAIFSWFVTIVCRFFLTSAAAEGECKRENCEYGEELLHFSKYVVLVSI